MIYYANNGTNRNNSLGNGDALTIGWIGPSVTPLTNLNSGFRACTKSTQVTSTSTKPTPSTRT